jgi:C-terminal processing protease CtpA/Prc
MRVLVRLMRAAVGLIFICSTVLVALTQQPSSESGRIDRLVGLARLWAAVKYFHPYLAYRDDIDWDAALIKAIPKVDGARTPEEYSAAIAGMLSELGDPATHVLTAPSKAAGENSTPPEERQPTFRKNADGILIVTMTNYSAFQDFVGTREKLGAIKKQLPTATGVVFDLRPTRTPSESEQGMAAYGLSESGLPEILTSVSLDLPGERRRMHIGYPPQQGTTSGDYSSGFYLKGRQTIKPGSGAKDVPVVFLIGPYADLPDMALGLQAAGRGAVVVEGTFNEEVAVSTQNVDLPEGVRAQIRLGEMVYGDGTVGFEPNLTVPASNVKGDQNPACQAALQLIGTGKFTPPPRTRLPERAAAGFDKTYPDMAYPPAEYRLLAAFRIWAVINYFYPYKEYMGEDWDTVLRQFIPRMESAKDALDYNLTVAEMVTHIHDSHGGVASPVLREYFGDSSAPIRVRIIEGIPVITGFTNVEAARDAGLEIGDVILKVDGEGASLRIQQRLRYMAHSTPQSGMFYATERALVRGPKDSTATFTVRDLHDQVREVKVARKTEYMPKTQGDRSGDVLRVLPGNIGYADLDRLTVPQVDEMFEKFKDCPAIIFDNRGYPNGTAWQIAPRLTEKNGVVAAMFKRLQPMAPDVPNGDIANSQMVDTFLQSIPPTDKWRYHGRTLMLIDERTISQAEHTGLFFEAANHTKFIGSPTQGANGDVTNLSLPGGIYVYFSGEGVWHADGRQLQRVGLQPDLEVHPTLTGIRASKDEVLDKAVEYLQRPK